MTVYVGRTVCALLFALLISSNLSPAWPLTATNVCLLSFGLGKGLAAAAKGPLLAGQKLTLKLGFSHDTIYTIPETMRAFLPDPTTVGLYGIDKEEVIAGPTGHLQLW